MTVLVDGRRVGIARAVHRACAIGVVVAALAEIPAVIGAGLRVVYLLPALPADVVDAQARTRDVGIQGHPEGVPEAQREGLFAIVSARGASRLVAPAAVRSRVGVGTPPSRLMRKT